MQETWKTGPAIRYFWSSRECASYLILHLHMIIMMIRSRRLDFCLRRLFVMLNGSDGDLMHLVHELVNKSAGPASAEVGEFDWLSGRPACSLTSPFWFLFFLLCVAIYLLKYSSVLWVCPKESPTQLRSFSLLRWWSRGEDSLALSGSGVSMQSGKVKPNLPCRSCSRPCMFRAKSTGFRRSSKSM